MTMKQRRRNLLRPTGRQFVVQALILVLMIGGVSMVQNLLTAPLAQAAVVGCPTGTGTPYGTSRYCGYFTNQGDTAGTAVFIGGFPPGVTDVPSFIGFMTGKLTAGTPQDRVGAAFIIETMMGRNQGTPQADADFSPNPASTYQQWVAAVTSYGNAGRIDWNFAAPFPCGVLNSYHENAFNDDAFYYEGANGCGGLVASIRFINVDGSDYVLKRSCANPIGGISHITALDMNMITDLGAVPTASPGNILDAGSSYTISPVIWNAGQGASDTVYLELRNPNPAFITATGVDPAGPWGFTNGMNAVGCSANYPDVQVWGSSPGSGSCLAPHWYWGYNGIPSNAGDGQVATFTVNPTTPDGTNLCFQADAVHRSLLDLTSFSMSVQQCYTIRNPRFPSVQALNSDVNAGGLVASSGSCNLSPVANINTLPAAQSFGQYVVSSTGAISPDFGSNNAAGSTALNIGKGGGYGQICRPDLVAVAAAYYNQGLPSTSPTNSFSLNGKSGVYILPNGDIHITGGSISNSVTLVALNGTVYIDGNVTLDPTAKPRNVIPSLGIIASNGINIKNTVTLVDAYMFTNGTIDTCTGGANACNTTLFVNGFMMAHTILLHRAGPAGTYGLQVGEKITLNPQIYLNPPKLFDASVDKSNLSGQGEKQPLY